MSVFNFRTGRKVSQNATIVSDLDKMIAEPIAFRLHGKIHTIEPISVKEFYAYTNALARLNALRDKENIENGELVDAYFNLFTSVCKSIKIEDLENMTQAQVGALFQLVIDSVTGKAYTSDEEKKKPTTA